MNEDLVALTTEELLRKYREAIVYTALSNNGADEDCLAVETEFANELNRRLDSAAFGVGGSDEELVSAYEDALVRAEKAVYFPSVPDRRDELSAKARELKRAILERLPMRRGLIALAKVYRESRNP